MAKEIDVTRGDKNEIGISVGFICLNYCVPILYEAITRGVLHDFLFIPSKEIKHILALSRLSIPS